MDVKTFDHGKASVSDRIAVIGEMEHLRRHALRSAIAAEKEEESFRFLIWATSLRDMRRSYMSNHFGLIDEKYWCMCKSAACLRQLIYEVDGDDMDTSILKDADNLVDDIWGTAVGVDLSDCEACRNDKNPSGEEIPYNEDMDNNKENN